MAIDNKQIAIDVLAAVGGKENIVNMTHCMTRFRFNLKDMKVPNLDEIKKINGVVGALVAGGQLQVIIGQNVPKVYAEACAITGFAAQEGIKENLDGPKEKLTVKESLKRAGSNTLNYLSGSMTPLIPAMVAAGMFKTLMTVLGPDMLKVLTAESNLYITLDFIYDAFFYFIPIFIGYTASNKIGMTPVLGMYAGAVLLVPDFMALIGSESFTILGIPTIVNNYSQSLLPILLTVFVMSYINKFFKKIVPDILSTIFVPFLTMLVILPIELTLLAPLGSVLGNYVGNFLVWFGEHGGFLAVAVIAALWEFLVMSGMHLVVIMFILNNVLTNGFDACASPAATCATVTAWGVALGAFLRLRNKDEKALSLSYFVSGIIGGVTEPALYGICFKYKRPFITMALGGFIGGLYAGITHVARYVLGSANVLCVLGFVAGGSANLVNAVISLVITLVATTLLTYFFGFSKEDLAADAAKAQK